MRYQRLPVWQRPTLLALMLGLTLLCAGAVGDMARADDSLYQDLGQKTAIAHFVDVATARWLADDRIKATFDNINITRFKRLLVDQLCEISGGPCHYRGRNMYLSHKGLHLDHGRVTAGARRRNSRPNGSLARSA